MYINKSTTNFTNGKLLNENARWNVSKTKMFSEK